MRRTTLALFAAALVTTYGLVAPAQAAGGPNLSPGKPVSASTSNGPYTPGNLNDGNASSYWESANNAFPQWAQVDLGTSTSIDQVVLKLPAGWGARSQTLSIQGSATGSSFTPIVASASYSFAPGSANTVTINFPAAATRFVRVNITANTGWQAAQLSELEIYAAGTPSGNLALGRPTTESGHADVYGADRIVDGNQGTYWESVNNSFPEWAQVDLGAAVSVDRVVLKLPASGWGSRTQTLSVQGSTNGTSFTDLKASATYTFDPAVAGNSVAITFTATSARYVRINITANSAWPAGQLSELEVYGAGGPVDTTPPSVPGTLSYSVSGTTITLNWGASTDNAGGSGMAGYDIYRNGSLAQTVGNVTTWNDTQPATATVSYFVRARDNASNVSGNSNTVTRQGTEVDTTPPGVPGTLSYLVAGTTITLNWGASTDNAGGSGMAGYNIYRNGSLAQTVGNVTTWNDTQPATATVSYYVRARDNAGNLSGNSNTVTRQGTQPPGCNNVASGKTMTASGSTFTFTPEKANDGQLSTYWEGAAGYPQHLIVALGANHHVTAVRVKLNPDPAWGTRTQNIEILGRDQGSSSYTTVLAGATYQFVQGNNVVEIPVTATTADVQLRFHSNSGAPSGQVAELEVCGTPAPNPDLVVSNVSWTPASPTETSAITLSATVQNIGTAASPGTTVNFVLGGSVVGSAAVGGLNAGASTTVSFNAGTRAMGSYSVVGVVDPTNTVVEQNNANNTFTSPIQLVVAQAPGPDLQVAGVTWNPPNPAVGAAVSFTVSVNNRGTTASAASVTRVTVGSTVLNGSTGAIAAGATVSVAISGTWTATSGGATIVAAADATGVVAETNETNNTLSQSIVVGRGAAVPWVSYEAEAAAHNGTLLTTDPLRTFGHTNFGTESSGRASVRLNSQGQFVEFTSANAANSIVVRNSIPDAAGGGGIDATISLYINGVFNRKLTLSSKHSWLYGTTDDPEGLTNTPQTNARRLFDESSALLSQSYPQGTKFKLQRDAGDDASFYIIDFIDLEQVAPALTQPSNCTSITAYGAVPNDGLEDTDAIQRAVTDDQNGVINCVWIPAGQWRQEKKILTDDPLNRGTHNQVGISNVTIRGAGMWHSQLYSLIQPHQAPGMINHPHEGNFGFDIDKNTVISDIAIFGSGRIRGGDGNAEGGVGLNGRFGVGTTISNVWIEHANVGVWAGRDFTNIPELWGPGDGVMFSGMRIRNTYADGINFANGTRNSTVFNSSFRTTGDDALAVWASQYVKDTSVDIGHDNRFANNTIQLVWRANGIAIYGGYGNKIENNLIYDTMNYPGIMLATDHDPLPFSGQTLIANNGLYRTGGAFWNEDQEFGAITLFAQSRGIPGVVIRDTDIFDSTYDGIQFKTGGGVVTATITNVRIDKSNNGAGILAMSGAQGSATLTNVVITNSADGDIVRQPGTQFVINGG
ncbi:discoidin domain-containing protein [Catelliglobosispora koreensis]|uniref:discoidin domain-containing protein n=1 Tax=Catelliglobosispora koreensis TaxID=129052 RepID=UPI00035DF908|nr:discoidin domain-containing protein [Catelliglobosispora koreensis]